MVKEMVLLHVSVYFTIVLITGVWKLVHIN